MQAGPKTNESPDSCVLGPFLVEKWLKPFIPPEKGA
jgi:hypothetical protein